MMLDAFRPGESILWDTIWQSTIFLGTGLGASVLYTRRPARAHRLLVLAMLAALAAPILAQGPRLGGWGLFGQSAESPPTRIAAVSKTPSATVDLPLITGESLPLPVALDSTNAATDNETRLVRPRGAVIAGATFRSGQLVVWRAPVLVGWLLISGVAVMRLATSLFQGRSLVRLARPLDDQALTAAAAAAGAGLGVRVALELRISAEVLCPSIWCWGRQPVIVLPEDAAAATSIDWAGVFCHELAHWLRGDRWSCLLGEVLVCALPWHPLAWWARHRTGQLSELACDDWVLASGLPATEYAESLLGLVPQRRRSLALAAVSSRRGLFGRVRHILDDRRSSPVVGVRWTCASAAAMVVGVSAVALAQTRPVDNTQESQTTNDKRVVSTPQPLSPAAKETTTKRTVGGTVLGSDGKPIVGAVVFWLSFPKATLQPLAIPKDRKAQRSTGADIVGEIRTDANGAVFAHRRFRSRSLQPSRRV